MSPDYTSIPKTDYSVDKPSTVNPSVSTSELVDTDMQYIDTSAVTDRNPLHVASKPIVPDENKYIDDFLKNKACTP
jgi:hypothetical protein